MARTIRRLPEIRIYQRNTATISLTFDPAEVQGATVFFTVKTVPDQNMADTSALIKKDSTAINPTTGRVIIPLDASDVELVPGRYVYDIKVSKGNNWAQTLGVGQFNVFDVATLRG